MKPYRAIPIDGKDFVYGWYCYVQGNHYIILQDAFRRENGIYSYRKVIPETVGQQIGLQDKNKEEIYAGDKLKSGKRILTVMWDGENMQWKAKEDGYHYLTPLCQWAISEQFEIIHPKLLEKL